jgi:hypothetical protein
MSLGTQDCKRNAIFDHKGFKQNPADDSAVACNVLGGCVVGYCQGW